MEYGLQLAVGVVLALVVKGLSYPRVDQALGLVLAVLLGLLAALGAPVGLFAVPVAALALLAVWPVRAAVVLGFGGIAELAMRVPHLAWPSSDGALVMAAVVLGIVMILMTYNWRWWAPSLQLAVGLGTPALLLAMADLAENGHLPASVLVALPAVAWAIFEKRKWRRKIRKM